MKELQFTNAIRWTQEPYISTYLLVNIISSQSISISIWSAHLVYNINWGEGRYPCLDLLTIWPYGPRPAPYMFFTKFRQSLAILNCTSLGSATSARVSRHEIFSTCFGSDRPETTKDKAPRKLSASSSLQAWEFTKALGYCVAPYYSSPLMPDCPYPSQK